MLFMLKNPYTRANIELGMQELTYLSCLIQRLIIIPGMLIGGTRLLVGYLPQLDLI